MAARPDASMNVPSDRPTEAEALYTVVREVPGADGRTVTIELGDDHAIHVIRDGGWSGFNMKTGLERYRWEGGVPNPSAPTAPDGSRHKHALYSQPVTAVMGKKPNRKLAEQVWTEMWAELAPHLEPRAATLADTYGYAADVYQMLAARPDLCDHLEVAPALGPFMIGDRAASIPEAGWDLKRIAEHLVSKDPDEPTPLSPGFIAWARALTWETARLPIFSRARSDRFVDMRSFVRTAASLGEDLDPNGVAKLETDDEWLVLNQALFDKRAVALVPGILANPKTAVKRVKSYFPPLMENLPSADGGEVKRNRRSEISAVLDVVIGWAQANPEDAGRVDSFSGAVKRARAWDIDMRAVETRQASSMADVTAEIERRIEAERAAAEAEIERERQRHRRTYGHDPLPEDYDSRTEFPGMPPEEMRAWTGPFDTHEDQGVIDMTMRMLTCGADLKLEGSLAKHCVAGRGYIAKCWHAWHGESERGRSAIFTLRDTASEEAGTKPEMVYTVEFSLPDWKLQQLQGRNNRFGRGHRDHREEWERLKAFADQAVGELRPRIEAWLAERAIERTEEKLRRIQAP